MKKLLLVLSFCLLLFSCGKDEPIDPRANDYVYVCSSNSAKTYHTFRDCSALKSCKEGVLEVTRHKAQENERIVCMNCKKREDEGNKNKDSVK